MPEIWPPPPEHQTPPVPPPSEWGRDILFAAFIADVLVPVNFALVYLVPGPHSTPPWWPYVFAVTFGGLLICWMYGFFGGLLYCRSRWPRLGLIISAATLGLALLLYQIVHRLGHGF